MAKSEAFNKIGITGKPGSAAAMETINQLSQQLINSGKAVFIPQRNHELVDTKDVQIVPFNIFINTFYILVLTHVF